MESLVGHVKSGKHEASRWLTRFNGEYAQKLGTPVFPGSLNVVLEREFDWPAVSSRYKSHVIWFGREEYGGERDILMLPCLLISMDGRRGFLWTTTIGAHQRDDPREVEILADVNLRKTYGLQDGDRVVLGIPWGEP